MAAFAQVNEILVRADAKKMPASLRKLLSSAAACCNQAVPEGYFGFVVMSIKIVCVLPAVLFFGDCFSSTVAFVLLFPEPLIRMKRLSVDCCLCDPRVAERLKDTKLQWGVSPLRVSIPCGHLWLLCMVTC